MDKYRRSYLDDVWRRGGTERLRRVFAMMAARDKPTLLRHLNDDRLGFPVLFIVMKDLHKLSSFEELSPRNLTALRVCAVKMTIPGWNDETQGQNTALPEDGFTRDTLLWMFDTGRDWQGPSSGRDAYDMIIDYVASLLVVVFDDRTVLPDIAELIFRRNRKGEFIHDLVWCFFQTLDRKSPLLIAERLLSSNAKDVELASRLLHLEMPEPMTRAGQQERYNEYINWLNENRPYLFLTGEHFQQTSSPHHLDLDMEAKYLGKEISPRYKTPVEPLTESEAECLQNFRAAGEEERELLTDYSYRLRSRNMQRWDEWMHRQIAEQVLAARTEYEVI